MAINIPLEQIEHEIAHEKLYALKSIMDKIGRVNVDKLINSVSVPPHNPVDKLSKGFTAIGVLLFGLGVFIISICSVIHTFKRS